MRKLTLLSMTAVFLSACDPAPDPQLQILQAENQQLKQQLTQQSQQLSQLLDQNKQLTTQLGSIQTQIASLQSAPAPLAVAATSPPEPDEPDNGSAQPMSLPAASTSVVIEPSGADRSKKLEPGWIVEAYPLIVDPENDRRYIDASDPPISLGSFVAPPGQVGLLDHVPFVKGDNHVRYEAQGFIAVQTRGLHAFSLNLEQKAKSVELLNEAYLNPKGKSHSQIACDLNFSIEGTPVINSRLAVGVEDAFAANGGADLVEGLYSSKVAIACNELTHNRQSLSQKNPYGRKVLRELLKSISVEISVRRPGTPSLDQMGPQDVVYISDKGD